jgi:hypothetical protein
VLSDDDVYNPYNESIAWDRANLQDPKTVVSLWNASHEGPFMSASDPHFDLVARITIGWLDSTLKAHPEALSSAMSYVASHPSLAAIG